MADAVLRGEIAAFRLPDVLTLLSAARKSGTLVVEHGPRGASLFFEQGALVFASSTQEQFRLGSILLRKRKITPQQRARIDELMQREGGRFGQLAVQEQVFSDEQLRDFLKIQVSEIVFDAFVWNGGSFSFVTDATLPPYAVTIAIDLPNLIMEGARRIEEWEQCIALLPDKSVVFRVVAAPRGEQITLTAEEWKLLFLINGQRTLEELCASAEEPLPVYRVIYGLYANKLIEEVRGARSEENQDATVRQDAPRFGAESTVRDEEANDDTSLLLSTEGRMSYAEAVRPTLAQLRVDSGDLAGRIIPLAEPEYLIGRHRDNGIQIPDLGVSGFHARIYRGPDGFVLEDLKSRNGTWINGTRVYQATLVDGDRVHVGQTDLIYEVLG
ncbi:MAG TPA: DUF4388 domain-containing protein [Thermoanaerobaculia bacterium]|jgi:hypothetical protein|nr:DUF4388 domain-containing protein [Thermoanaerobaculia bacterium]